MKIRKKLIWIIIIALVAGGVFWYFKTRKPEIQYTTEEVKRGSVSQTVSVTGEVLPEKQVDLAFETIGKVTAVNVEIGNEVTKGRLIAKIDGGVTEAQLRQAEEDLAIQQENLDLMRRKWDDYKPEEKEAQKATVRKYQSAAQVIREQLKKTELRSPIDGIVTKINIDMGESVAANTAAVTVIRKNDFEIESDVPESDIIKVKVDQSAVITFDAFPSENKFSAKVVGIEPASTVIQDVVYYKVKLKLDNPDPRIKAGMSADVDINIEEKKDVLKVSEIAVKKENGNKTVQVLLNEGQTKTVPVETGLRGDDGTVEIVSGLKEGDTVITFQSEK